MKRILLLLTMILLISPVIAQENVKDVEVEILLSDVLEANVEYTELFLIRNINDTPGENDNLFVNVTWSLIEEFSYLKNINYYSKSGMGSVNLSNGNYTICVSINGTNYIDPNPSNDYSCKDLVVSGDNDTIVDNKSIVEENETEEPKYDECAYTLNVYTKYDVYSDGNTIEFMIYLNNDTNKSYPFEIGYWVEDLHGKVVKKKLNTTSKAQKRYTPHVDTEKAFLIKAESSKCNLFDEKLVVAKGEVEEKDSFIEILSPSEASGLFYVEISGYKGETGKTLLSLQLEMDNDKISDVTKVYVFEKNVEFKFKVPVVVKEEVVGRANLVVSGLGFDKKKSIDIINEKEESIIESFYTRKKKFENKINVYATVLNPSDYYFVVESSNETKILEAEKEIELEIGINEADEKLNSYLMKEIDSSELELELEYYKEAEAVVLSANDKPVLNVTHIPPVKEKKNPNYVFFVLALAASALLFRKDLRGFLFKKTKLFK